MKNILSKYAVGLRRVGAGALLCLCIAAAIILNLVLGAAEQHRGLRADCTKESIYTLSETTRKLLDGLERDIHIYMVYSPGNADARVRELLAEYNAYSPHVQVTVLSAAEAEALLPAAVRPENGILISDDTGTVQSVFEGSRLYELDGEGQPIRFAAESKITAAIEGICRGAFCSIRLLTGHGETPPGELQGFLALMEQNNYAVSEYDFSTAAEPLNAKTDLLVAVSPKADLESSEYERISQFMQQGGRMLLLADQSSFNTAQGVLQVYTAEQPLFTRLLADYNLRIRSDILVAADAHAINLRHTSFGVQPLMHQATAQLVLQGQEVVVSEAAGLQFLEGGEAKVSMLLMAQNGCFSKPLSQELTTLRPEPQDTQDHFAVAALSERKMSRLAVVTDAQCVGDTALSAAGNGLFFRELLYTLSPIEPSEPVPAKGLQLPRMHPGLHSLQTVMAFVACVLLPLGVLYLGIRARSARKKH